MRKHRKEYMRANLGDIFLAGNEVKLTVDLCQ